jgi:DNA-binding CsgD family transcriptional regulator
LVLSLDGQELSATSLPSLADPESDALRRRLLAHPVRLGPGSAEADLIRAAEGGRHERIARGSSVLHSALALGEVALGVVMPEDRVVALLVGERAEPPVGYLDCDRVQQIAHLVGFALERLVLRQRMEEYAAELRHLTASAQALLVEGLESPIALPADHCGAYSPADRTDALRQLFTRRELTIIDGLVAGRSNPAIAAELQLSPETVKKYIARVMRKLGASSRADAAVRYVRMAARDSTC